MVVIVMVVIVAVMVVIVAVLMVMIVVIVIMVVVVVIHFFGIDAGLLGHLVGTHGPQRLGLADGPCGLRHQVIHSLIVLQPHFERAFLVLARVLARDRVGPLGALSLQSLDLGLDRVVVDDDVLTLGDRLDRQAAAQRRLGILGQLAAQALQVTTQHPAGFFGQITKRRVDLVVDIAFNHRPRHLDGVRAEQVLNRRPTLQIAAALDRLVMQLLGNAGLPGIQAVKAQVLGQFVVERGHHAVLDVVERNRQLHFGTGGKVAARLARGHSLFDVIAGLGAQDRRLDFLGQVARTKRYDTLLPDGRRIVAAHLLRAKVDLDLVTLGRWALDRRHLSALFGLLVQCFGDIFGIGGHAVGAQGGALVAGQLELGHHLDLHGDMQVGIALQLRQLFDFGAAHGAHGGLLERLEHRVFEHFVEHLPTDIAAVHPLDHRCGRLAGAKAGQARLGVDAGDHGTKRGAHMLGRHGVAQPTADLT